MDKVQLLAKQKKGLGRRDEPPACLHGSALATVSPGVWRGTVAFVAGFEIFESSKPTSETKAASQ
jgi:hypothetical protein